MNAQSNAAFSADRAMEPYWEAAANGKLLLSDCRGCGRVYYYPRPICPFCMSADTGWKEAEGGGTVYSWSVERRADPPYAIAFVTLDEGPTLLTNLVDHDFDSIAVGDRVKLRFKQRDERAVPVFVPDRDG
ncbi:MAG: Zn-ribbon domain-containing OB-fold protein [Gammaproteobacteria bacterium]